ncbi:MAG: MFS transporter [Candidatus Peregrinibacteria bacterium]
MSRFFNRALRVLLLANGLILTAAATLGPIYSLFVKEIGGDLLDASLTFAIFSIVAALVTFVSGKLSDKVRHSVWVIVMGYLLVGMGFLLYLFVYSLLSLFLVQVIIGFGEAIYAPAFDKLYSKHLMSHLAGTAWGAWESLRYLTLAIGAVLGGIVVTRLGFDTLFVIMGLMSFASAAYLANRHRVFKG